MITSYFIHNKSQYRSLLAAANITSPIGVAKMNSGYAIIGDIASIVLRRVAFNDNENFDDMCFGRGSSLVSFVKGRGGFLFKVAQGAILTVPTCHVKEATLSIKDSLPEEWYEGMMKSLLFQGAANVIYREGKRKIVPKSPRTEGYLIALRAFVSAKPGYDPRPAICVLETWDDQEENENTVWIKDESSGKSYAVPVVSGKPSVKNFMRISNGGKNLVLKLSDERTLTSAKVADYLAGQNNDRHRLPDWAGGNLLDEWKPLAGESG